jgi:hypothetical protein
MKTFQTCLFQPKFSRIDSGYFSLNVFFHPAFLPLRLWDGAFHIPEGLRKLFPGPWTQPKTKNENQGESGEKRTNPRLEFHSKVLVYPLRPHDSEKPFRGGLKNLSKSGVCIECAKPFSDAQLVLLDFQLSGEKNIQIPAQVVWSKNKMSGFELLNPDGIDEILKDTRQA